MLHILFTTYLLATLPTTLNISLTNWLNLCPSMKQGNYFDVARGKVFQVVRKQELQEVLKFPIDIF